jgi:hypothetical protein
MEINYLKIGGTKLNNKQATAREFNKYFVNIADKIKTGDSSKGVNTNDLNNDVNHIDYMKQAFNCPYPDMNYNYSTSKEIEKIIKSFKPKNSCGYDEISPRILKASSPFISSPINYICNKMLREGVFPERLKYAQIIPLYKSGDKYDMTNYRPISLLTSFSKIFETIIHSRALDHLNKYNILSSEQYGFRKGLKTDNAIYKLTAEIQNAMNNKSTVGGIFCDLEKAFDCVDHDILLAKLKFYGIKGKVCTLFESYLKNRCAKTVIFNNGRTSIASEWLKVHHGVPQGSVLGPLLFLLYINDLPKIINKLALPIIFADDTSILLSNINTKDFEECIHKTLDYLNRWFKTNKLSLNLNKTHYIHFKTKRNMSDFPIISYNNKCIKIPCVLNFWGL